MNGPWLNILWKQRDSLFLDWSETVSEWNSYQEQRDTPVLAESKNNIILFVYPSKFWISIVFFFFVFSCDLQLETMLSQNGGGGGGGGETKSIMVFSEVAYIFSGTTY